MEVLQAHADQALAEPLRAMPSVGAIRLRAMRRRRRRRLLGTLSVSVIAATVIFGLVAAHQGRRQEFVTVVPPTSVATSSTAVPSVTYPPPWQGIPVTRPSVREPLRGQIVKDADAYNSCMTSHGYSDLTPIAPTWGDGKTPAGIQAPIPSGMEAAFNTAQSACQAQLRTLQQDTSAGLSGGDAGLTTTTG